MNGPGPIDRCYTRMETLNPAILAGAVKVPPHPIQGSTEPDIGPVVQAVLTSLDDSKAEDIVSIDLHGKTSIADAMIIATGRSNTHVGAIADHLLKVLKDLGRVAPKVEGLQSGDWVLVDAGDVIVHIFRPEVRQFYNLEKMWGLDRPSEQRPL